MTVSMKEDLRTKEDFEGKPNSEFIPDKKEGFWSFAHDKKQIIGDYDYVPNNSLLKKKIEDIASFISDDDLFYKEHDLNEVKQNQLVVIKNILKEAEKFKGPIRNAEDLKTKIQRDLLNVIEDLFPLYNYCTLEEEEYRDAKETFEDQVAILKIQAENIANAIESTMLQYKQIHEMLEKYAEKKSILGD